MRSNLGRPPAPHWTDISYVALSTSASSTAASDQLYLVWGLTKGKSTGSDHTLAKGRHHNLVLVCFLLKSNLGRPPAPHWADISYVALSTSAAGALVKNLQQLYATKSSRLHGMGTKVPSVLLVEELGWTFVEFYQE